MERCLVGLPQGRSFILVSFNIFINDLEEGVNSTLIIITSDAKLRFVTCTKAGDSERTRQDMDPGMEPSLGKNNTTHGRRGNQPLGGSEAKRLEAAQYSFWNSLDYL